MKTALIVIVLGLFMMVSTSALALPIEITVGSPYVTNPITLGTELPFQYKWEIPVPYPGDCILQHVVGTRNAREIMECGEFYHPEESLQLGIVDQVLPIEQVLSKSIEKVKKIGVLPHKAFKMIKLNRVEKVKVQIQKNLNEKERFFIDSWYSDEAHGRLKEAIKRFRT